MSGEIGFFQRVVRAALATGQRPVGCHVTGNVGCGERFVEYRGHVGIGVRLARVDLIGNPMIDPGVKVAGRARRGAITADLHVPEQRLAQQDCGTAIEDVIGHQVDFASALGA
ncbi:hypothetical protein D3C73_798740 [compost metagenome]